MTDKTHLDDLLDKTTADLGKKLVTEFMNLVRYPETATSSYPVKLRAVLEECLQDADDASG